MDVSLGDGRDKQTRSCANWSMTKGGSIRFTVFCDCVPKNRKEECKRLHCKGIKIISCKKSSKKERKSYAVITCRNSNEYNVFLHGPLSVESLNRAVLADKLVD